ncbi:MAG: ABC transporter permease, partial [Hyphomicrobiales bacterium]
MSLLDRKLMRDVRSLRGPIMTIALVIATGIAVFIASISTYASLLAARESFYVETRFPQVFVSVTRAPRALLPQIEAIPGVIGMTARIVRDAVVDRPAARSPVSARIVSIENAGDEPLARLVPRRGTAPSPGDARQIAVNEAFAEANRIEP